VLCPLRTVMQKHPDTIWRKKGLAPVGLEGTQVSVSEGDTQRGDWREGMAGQPPQELLEGVPDVGELQIAQTQGRQGGGGGGAQGTYERARELEGGDGWNTRVLFLLTPHPHPVPLDPLPHPHALLSPYPTPMPC
jgi:hypothetical protein